MKRPSLLLLLPLASGALLAQVQSTISPTSIPNGTVGVSYLAVLNVTPLLLVPWSISAGSLPPGLTLSPAPGAVAATGASQYGVIGGRPTTPGTYSFTVQADLGNSVVQRGYTVTIVLPTVSLASASQQYGAVGVGYYQTLAPSGGYGPGTYTFALTAGSLPPGLQVNVNSGVIYGTPTVAGSYSFTLQVASLTATYPVVTAYGTFSIYIYPPALTITTSSLPAGTVGTAYSQALAATGGTPPYTWRLTGSTLPVGLTLATSGTFSGTPTTAGSFTYQVVVTDSELQPASASGSFTIRIAAGGLVITTTSLPNGNVGDPYTATLAATGGTPPYTWQVPSGSLPGGLTLDPTGTLRGTPSAAGSFTFQVAVRDSQQGSGSATITIRIAAAALVITTTSLPNGNVGDPYTATLAATGGTPPYTWSVASGALPNGLSINSAGVISGTPAAAGTPSVILQVTDSAQATATKAYNVNVTLTATVPLPTVKGVTNAASYATGAVSPGELVTLFGTAIGPAAAASATTDVATGKLATTIGGVQVLFNGTLAPMIYASSMQVSAVVPYEMAPVANPSVWIKYLGQTSNVFQLSSTTTAPGLFTQNASGSGPGAILNQDNSVNGPGNRAAKGSIVQVYLTGEGLTSPPSVTGAITTATLPPPQVTPAPLLAVGVTINGQPALYVYAGEAPGLVAGMMQLNVQIPANAASGELPILVSIGGNTSQKGVTVSVQ